MGRGKYPPTADSGKICFPHSRWGQKISKVKMDLSGVGGPLLDMLSNKKNSQVIMIIQNLTETRNWIPYKAFVFVKFISKNVYIVI